MNSQSPGPGNRRPATTAEAAPNSGIARNSRERPAALRLPDQRELVAAFTAAEYAPAGQPLLTWANALAHLHRRRHGDPLSTAGIDCRRSEVVELIDRWVSAQATAARPRRIRADSPGTTIDRMAAAHVHANHLLHHCERVSDDRVHAAWYRLALLADEWTDLVTGAEPVRRRD
ncbi:DUF4254 domain-containing protein [Nocardia carnea]|uniref:DUF4254 domain-containing protein n=1 Tax=Nocardia carnea TaxID=37328 RepID=UPI002455D074|nr:DUF4254 domain-containing protein [Nocardia carnea]